VDALNYYSSYLNNEVRSFRFRESGVRSQETMPNQIILRLYVKHYLIH
jgi:hypothetical protein